MLGTTAKPLETRRSAGVRPSFAHRLCKLCSPAVAADLTLLVAAASVAGTAVLSHALYYPLVLDSPAIPADYALIGLAVALVYFFTARFVFHLDFEKLEQGLESGAQSVKALLVAATIFLVAVFLTQTTEAHSRGWFLAWMAGAALVLMLLHVAAARLFEAAVRLPESPYRRRVAVFGTHELVASFAEHLSQRRHFRTSLVHSASILPDISAASLETAIDHFIAHCRQNPVSEVVIALPRPHPIALNDQYMSVIDQYATRHAVLPGITGWAQVNAYRGETDTPEKMAGRIAHDLNYIRNCSFSLDFWILCLTVIRGFVHKNAY